MSYILFDSDTRYRLLPFTHTRPIADIRCGIFTMRERWEHLLKEKTSTLTVTYLQEVYPAETDHNNIYINAAVFATEELAIALKSLPIETSLISGNTLIAIHTCNKLNNDDLTDISQFTSLTALNSKKYPEIKCLNNVWDIFSLNDYAIRADYEIVTKDRISAPIPQHITVTGKSHIFIEEGAVINAGCIINATTGPVYIGKDSEILEGSIIRGPLALCEHSVIKMGAKIYGATTIGNGSKVGGEISNAVFFSNSNKGHDGFLGNAVIGEWCNLGADTNCSNLKNNYDEVKIWDEHNNRSVKTGLTFCGLMMGDHSKCGINTMFNTGTVVGVSSNIFGAGFPEKFVPSFCWGGADGMTTYSFERAMDTAARMMARRNVQMSDAERSMYQYLFAHTTKQRELFAH